jgi:rubrerythrin
MPQTSISVFEYAIRSEEEGAAFYSTAARSLPDGPEKAFLADLAGEESKHAEIFRQLKEKVAKKGVVELFGSAEVSDYLDAVARGGLFESARGAVPDGSAPKTMEDVYAIAIRAERSSILLYGELAEQAKDKAARKVFEGFVREEKNHLVRIVALRADHDTMFAIERFGCVC